MKTLIQTSLLACLLTATQWASAQAVDVTGAWARATVQGQKASGAFMQLTAPQGARLVGVSSPVAGVAEIHEMKMEGDVMKMRALPNGLDLPAGKAVTLSLGGYHLMLMDLKVALQKDTTIPITLVFKDAKGVESKKELRVPVSVAAPSGTAMPAGHGAMAMPQGSDAAQIAAIMKKQFERPDAPLAVEPVTVDGTVAIAGWIQGSKGGRAMLQKDAGQWMITLCAGADLVQAKALQATGLSASQATQLVKAVQLAESKLSPKQRQLFDSFEGMVKIDSAHGAHGAAPAAAGKHH